MHSHYAVIRALIGCTALLLTQSAQTAGFYISEVGTPGSLGTAGVANPVNRLTADSSWTNPAGMMGIKQDEILTGFQKFLPRMEFDPSLAEAGGDDGGNAGNIAARKGGSYSVGFSYDSSPVRNRDRTIDLPFDETYKISAAYGWKLNQEINCALGGTLLYFGDGKVDQTAQGVRFKGEFDTNTALFPGGTLRYIF